MKIKSNAEVVIADLAAKAGVILSDVGADALASLLSASAPFTPGQAVTADDGAGGQVKAADWFAAKIKEFPAFLAPKPAEAPAAQQTGNRTDRAIATLAASKRDRSVEAKELVARFGNPWKTGNRTHQAFVTNTNEVLANRLRQEAGR